MAGDYDQNREQDHNENVGWSLISFDRIRDLLAPIAATLAVAGFLTLFGLFMLGAMLICRLVAIAWSGTEEESVRAAATSLTAIAAVFGAAFLTWRTVVAHWQARASQQQVAISRESHYTSLFTRAVEQLGATREVTAQKPRFDPGEQIKFEVLTTTEPNLEVRVGAIYALERIARDSERDHWPIMEVLCTYIRSRQNCGEPSVCSPSVRQGTSKWTEWQETVPPLRVDVQAALRVIGRRPVERVNYEKTHGLRLNFSKANLQRANLSGGDFSRANFKIANLDSAALNSANLEEGNFWGASMHSSTIFDARAQSSCFAYARLDDVVFGRSRLDDCLFLGASVRHTSFYASQLRGARFFSTDLSNAYVSAEQLAETLGDSETKAPQKMARPQNWLDRRLNDEESRKYVSAVEAYDMT